MQKYEFHELKTLSERLASDLMAELKVGKIPAIGIDVIRKRVMDHFSQFDTCHSGDVESLEKMVVRRVVEKVG